MSDAGEFVDATLQREASWERALEHKARLGSDLRFYGASVGAIRGTVRDALRRYPGMSHDDITTLSSELWAPPVYERRLAAVVLLQSTVRLLHSSDLTRIEGFIRTARLRELVDPLAVDVVGPVVEGLRSPERARADAVIDRWARENDAWLRRAAILAPLRALRSGGGDWRVFERRVATAEAIPVPGYAGAIVQEAVTLVSAAFTNRSPEAGS